MAAVKVLMEVWAMRRLHPPHIRFPDLGAGALANKAQFHQRQMFLPVPSQLPVLVLFQVAHPPCHPIQIPVPIQDPRFLGFLVQVLCRLV